MRNKLRSLANQILLFVVFILLTLGLSRWQDLSGSGELPPLSPLAPVTPSPTPTPTTSPAIIQGPIVVSRVIDGDTVELESGETVRYIGIDTPETRDPRQPVQCFGREAAARNQELVEGEQVWLEKDITDRDRFGRLLRYVHIGDPASADSLFVNLQLVRDGFARASTYPPDVKHQELFLAAQTEARGAGRGLWSACQAPADTISP